MSIYRAYGILRAMRVIRRLALLAGIACVLPLLPLIAETVRERASIHFDTIHWSTDPSSVPAVASPAAEAAGGTEAFPALTPLGDSGLPAVYPEIGNLGPLDYSGVDGDLLAALYVVSSDLLTKSLSAERCDPVRPFVPVLTNYRLERVNEPERVYFSRPDVLRDAGADEGNGLKDGSGSGVGEPYGDQTPLMRDAVSEDTPDASIGAPVDEPPQSDSPVESVFYLSCKGPSGLTPVLIGVTLVKSGKAWIVSDVTIDGGSYAAATRKD